MVKYKQTRIKSSELVVCHSLMIKRIEDCLVHFGEAEQPISKLLICPKEF